MFIVGFTLTDEAGRKVKIDDTIAAKIKVSLRIHMYSNLGSLAKYGH
jgi:hypothetical protein